MQLTPDLEARILRAVRCVPDGDQEAAFKFIADLLRPVLEPSEHTVAAACGRMIRRYGANVKDKESAE